MTESVAKNCLWVTNLAAPYRLPVWEELGRRWTLRVGLLENAERLRRDRRANRGSDWAGANGGSYRVVEYKTARLARGEDRHYILTDPQAVRDVDGSDAVLLGGWDSPAYWQLLAQAKAMGKATVGFYESTLASQSRSQGAVARVRAWYYSRLDAVVVPGPAARDALLAMGVAPERIHTGFNAVDTTAFASAPKAAAHEGHHYLCVSQLIERKNLDGIIRAFDQVASSRDRLTIVGKGEEQAALETLASQLGRAQQVSFVPYVPNAELPTIMADHDTLVIASHVEVWGLVVNEALATGMQVVVTENCGVAPSVAGMPGVHLAMADAFDLAEVMGRARAQWRGRIEEPPILQYTPERFADVFADAFDQAIAAKESRRRR